MESFFDKNKNRWTIELTVGSARRVLAECNIDLLNVIKIDDGGIDTTVFSKLSDDPFLLVSVIFSLCKSQVEKQNLSADDFADLWDSETVAQAVDALTKEIINFSQPAKKKMLALLYNKTQAFQQKMEQQIEKTLSDPKFNAELDGQLNNLLTNLQESSE